MDGSLLKYYREENQLTIKDLSKKLHVSVKIIEAWEANKRIPRESDINELCSLYGISRDDLCCKKRIRKHNNITGSLIIIGLSATLGIILKDVLLLIGLCFFAILIFNTFIIIKNEYESSYLNPGPKSLIGVTLYNKNRHSRIKYYFIESLMISSLYSGLNVMGYAFKIDYLVILISKISNEMLNTSICWILIFIILLVFTFIIEYIFGETSIRKNTKF